MPTTNGTERSAQISDLCENFIAYYRYLNVYICIIRSTHCDTLCEIFQSILYTMLFKNTIYSRIFFSDSDEPPPLEDIVERPTLQQQYADFFELLIGDAHVNNR